MAKIETLGQYLNKPEPEEDEAKASLRHHEELKNKGIRNIPELAQYLKSGIEVSRHQRDEKREQSEIKTKDAGPQEKNKDYVITLDIDGNNRRFRDKASGFANFWDNAKTLLASWKNKFKEVNELPLLNMELEARQEAKKTADQAGRIVEQREQLQTIAEAMNTYASESPSQDKTQMQKAADMIERAGLKVEGGYGLIVEDLRKGGIPQERQAKASEVMDKLIKSQKWDKANLKILQRVQEQIKSSNGLGEALESAAEDLTKKDVYSKLGTYIREHSPIISDNKILAESLASGQPGPAALENGLKAVAALRKMSGGWPQEANRLFEQAERFMQKDLGNEAHVVAISRIRKNNPRQKTPYKKAA